MRRLLVVGLALAGLAGPVAAHAAPPVRPPHDCVTAWNRGATPAQKAALRKAARVQVSHVAGTGTCAVTFVLRGGGTKVAEGVPVAGPRGRTGVWTIRAPMLVGGVAPLCRPNATVLGDGRIIDL